MVPFLADRRQRCYAACVSSSLLSDIPSWSQPVGYTQRYTLLSFSGASPLSGSQG